MIVNSVDVTPFLFFLFFNIFYFNYGSDSIGIVQLSFELVKQV